MIFNIRISGIAEEPLRTSFSLVGGSDFKSFCMMFIPNLFRVTFVPALMLLLENSWFWCELPRNWRTSPSAFRFQGFGFSWNGESPGFRVGIMETYEELHSRTWEETQITSKQVRIIYASKHHDTCTLSFVESQWLLFINIWSPASPWARDWTVSEPSEAIQGAWNIMERLTFAETCTLVGKELPTEHRTTIHSPSPPETHTGKRPNPLHLCSENLGYFARWLLRLKTSCMMTSLKPGTEFIGRRGRRWWKLGFYAGVAE